jgi:hypothetical protein
MQFWRFLHNDAVTVAEMAAVARVRTAELAAGRDILVIQDSSEFCFGGAAARDRGFGRVGRHGSSFGFLLHAALCVDATDSEPLGLVDIQILNRADTRSKYRRLRATVEKESQRWLDGMLQASQSLHEARCITIVADRESDIYEEFATRPSNVHLITRAAQNRKLKLSQDDEQDALLFDFVDQLPERARVGVTIPAAPGRAARETELALRYSSVTIYRPRHGAAPTLPETVSLTLLDVREIMAPKGTTPVHWRLLTTHQIKNVTQARKVLDDYRKRWIIEEYFRTLKTAGFNVEDSEIESAPVMERFTCAASVAAVTIMQLVRARDGQAALKFSDVFDANDQTLMEKLCRSLEGKTVKQKNPHAKGSLAHASWTIARLGGWDGYYGKPGPKIMRIGLQDFQLVKRGHNLRRRDV